MKLIYKETSLIILTLILIPNICAAGWSSCESELEILSSEASNASDYARRAKNALSDLEDAKDELENCRTYPEVYDLLGDGCQSQYYDYESAKDDYESAVSGFRSEMSNVKGYMDSAESDCNSSNSATTDWVSVCRNILSLREKYDEATLLSACKSMMGETLCKACLNIK